MTAKARKKPLTAPGKLREFTVDRAVWRRGQRGLGMRTQLLNEAGGMCCLGIYLRACGAPPRRLYMIGTPSSTTVPRKAAWLVERAPPDGFVEHAFVTVNDDREITEATRERKLRALFKKHGVTVHFTGPKEVHRGK